MSDERLAAERAQAHEQTMAPPPVALSGSTAVAASHPVLLVVAWTAVAIPLTWGVWITLSKSLALFQ